MSLPRIAVIGSCVSRDVFNSRFTSDYKDYIEVTDTLYQSALPSIVRDQDIDRDLPDDVRPNFISVLKRELLGEKLARLAASKPDVLLIDFFADVHFGVTEKNGLYLTRNHMAFQTLDAADDYYDDEGVTPPERMRYEKSPDGERYRKLAKASIEVFGNILNDESPDTRIVLNSARFSTVYETKDGEIVSFGNEKRLLEKNDNWAELDEMFIGAIGSEHVVHQPADIVCSDQHPWGLHPVHYAQNYYDSLWKKLIKIISDE